MAASLATPGSYAITPGDTLLAFAALKAGVSLTAFTDGYGNTWKPFAANPYNTGALGGAGALLYGLIADNCAGGAADTFLLSGSGSEFITDFVLEFSGRNPAGALDQVVPYISTSYLQSHPGGQIVVGTNGEDVVAFGCNIGANAADTFTANTGAGFSIPTNGSQPGNSASYMPAFVQVKANVSASSTPLVASYSTVIYVQSAGFVVSLLPAPSSSKKRGMLMGVG